MLYNDKGLVLTTNRTIEPLSTQVKAMKGAKTLVFLLGLGLQNKQ